MKRITKRLRRVLSICLIASLLCGTCTNSVYAVNIVSATDSDAIECLEVDSEGYTATGPASEIDFSGEDFPVPYIAVVDDAFIAICAVIFAACGIVVNGENLRNLASDFYNWLSYHSAEYATAWKAAVTAGTLGVGAAIKGVGSLINAAKAYCLTIKGYGTNTKTYALPAVGGVPQYYFPLPSDSWAENYEHVFSYRTPIDTYGKFTVYDYFLQAVPLFAVAEGSSSSLNLYCKSFRTNGSIYAYGLNSYYYATTECDNGMYKSTTVKRYSASLGNRAWYNRDTVMECLNLPIFSTYTALQYYLDTGSLMHSEDLLYNPTGLSVSVRPIVDAQTKTADVADDIEVVIPSVDDIVSALADVVDSDDIADRLARTVTDFAWAKVPDIVIPTDPVNPDNPGTDNADSLLPTVSLKGLISSLVAAFGFTSVVTLRSILDSILSSLSTLAGIDTIILYLGDIKTQISNWSIDNWDQLLRSALNDMHISVLDDLLTSVNTISRWNIDSWDITLKNILEKVNFKGLDDINAALASLGKWTFADWQETFNLSITEPLLTALSSLPGEISSKISDALKSLGLDGSTLTKLFSDALSGLEFDIDLDKVKEMLSSIGLGALAGYLSSLLDLVGVDGITGSLVNIIDLIKALPVAIATAIASVFPDYSSSSESSENINDDGFKNFLNLFMVAIFILVLLIILFINCLRFIVLVFNIPASTTILNADLLSGIEYLKSLQLPIFGMSLYSFLLACAYFLIFMSIITVLRKKIDKIHI